MHSPWRLRWWQGSRVGALAILSWLILAGGVPAQTPTPIVFQLPAPPSPIPTTPPSGLSLTIDMTWVEGPGYHPVRLSVAPTAAVRFDRSLQIRLRVPRWWNDQNGIIVSCDLVVPAGTAIGTPIQRTVSIPQMYQWDRLFVTTLEDGFPVEELSSSWNIPTAGPSRQFFGPRRTAAILVLLGGDSNRVQAEVAALANSKFASLRTSNSQQSDSIIWAAPQVPGGTLPLIGLPMAELPTRWIDFSAVDVILTSVDDLKYLETKHPAQYAAVRQWLRAGGNLLVYDVGDEWQRLAELAQWMGLPALTSQGKAGIGDWRRPRPIDFSTVLNTSSTVTDAMAEVAEAGAAPPPDEKNPFFVWHPVETGVVGAMATSQPFALGDGHWRTLYNAIGPERWNWDERNGVAFDADNAHFFNFLIPGVGLPPVATFCVLISAFTLVIGPLNYFWLRRRSRLQFLILTVPIGAVLVSGSLVAYAFVADGLAVRVRARSITRIDQQTQQAVCWARLSYYAGMAPAGGLVFDADTVLYPLLPEAESWPHRSGSAPRRELHWDENQHFVSGWLTAREPTQFITVRARRTAAALGILQADATSPPRIENRLGTRIQRLVLMDAGGRSFFATDVAPDQTVETTPDTSDEPLREIAAAHSRNGLRPPAGMETAYAGADSSVARRNRLEVELSEACHRLTPRSYVAIVDRSPEVQFGTPVVSEEASFHVIVGHW